MKRSLEDGGRLHINICRRLRNWPNSRLPRLMDETGLFSEYELEGAQTLAANNLVGECIMWILIK